VRDAAEAQGYPHQEIVSGAGHDAVYMARVAPSAMVFVPCVGGIRHNEIEDAKPEVLTAGCNVLLNAVLDRANAVSTGLPSAIQPSGLRQALPCRRRPEPIFMLVRCHTAGEIGLLLPAS
jgi:hypothetical protein